MGEFITILLLGTFSLFILYFIIKNAVRKGVHEALANIEDSVLAMERHVEEIKKFKHCV